MNQNIKNIWIESEEKGSIIGGQKHTDDNSDVIVTFADDQKFVATFFTYENVITLTKKNRQSGENLSGLYFWASDMILIESLERINIEKVITELIKKNLFEVLFKPC